MTLFAIAGELGRAVSTVFLRLPPGRPHRPAYRSLAPHRSGPGRVRTLCVVGRWPILEVEHVLIAELIMTRHLGAFLGRSE